MRQKKLIYVLRNSVDTGAVTLIKHSRLPFLLPKNVNIMTVLLPCVRKVTRSKCLFNFFSSYT